SHETNSCLPRHHRLEQLPKLRERRNAVENDASAHDVECRLIEGECAGALQHVRLVTSRNFCADLLNDSPETDELVARVFCVFVRYRHVCRNAVDLYIRHSRHAFEYLVRFY